MRVLKRDGRKVKFNRDKVKLAVERSFNDVDGEVSRYAQQKAQEIASKTENHFNDSKTVSVEEIQDFVEQCLMATKRKDVAKNYILYREERTQARGNITDKTFVDFLAGKSDYWNKENSNKDAKVVTTQRDYLAGIASTDFARRFLLPKDVCEAHDEGIIHQHDMDYMAQFALSNCCLINLEDILLNGTTINGIRIDPQHRLLTATTVATQVITAVASSQYGGTTITLTHLSPFLRDSFAKYYKDGLSYLAKIESIDCEILNMLNNAKEYSIYDEKYMAYNSNVYEYALNMTKREVKDSVQTFNYQINSMSTTNGQSPFLSVNMYISENTKYEDETALLIEEFLKQRILGMKNENGVYITPAFPKLLYVLDENNIYENSKYWYLTELAAKCTSKRMVPDYISAKKMREYKISPVNNTSDVYPCMGAARGDETVSIKIKDQEYDNIPIEDAFYLVKREIQHQDTISGFRCNGYIGQPAKDFQGICGVYKLIHTPTGLYYIGSSKNISRRFIEHRSSFKHKGSLGDNYFIGDYDLNNLRLEILEECDINDLFEKESKYVDFKNKDANCVNQKDPIKNGNFTTENRGNALSGQKYSTYKNKAYTWVKKVNTPDILIKSSNEYVPIRAIMKNTADSPLEMYEITYANDGEYRSLNITEDHPLHTSRGRVRADDLEIGDELIDAITFETYPVVAIVKTGEKCETFDFETDNDKFDLSGIVSHNCRSFLTPDRCEENYAKALNYKKGVSKYYGRFNCGVTTINLADVAFSSGGNYDKFWKLLDERCELCHKGLRARIDRLEQVTSDVAPMLWQNGALARLEKGESLHDIIHHGYSTASLGFAGLYECVKYMTGHSHTDGDIGEKFGLEVMQALNDKCNEWKKAEDIDYSVYGTPLESTTYKFSKSLKKRFGDDIFINLDGKDRNYITNSYHVPVFEKINAFDKLRIESKFQKLAPGGAISYVECSNLTDNIPAVISVLKYIYNNIMYAELNTKSDYCQVCGYDGEMKIDDNMEWYCPCCGNRDQSKLNIARRTCGLTL